LRIAEETARAVRTTINEKDTDTQRFSQILISVHPRFSASILEEFATLKLGQVSGEIWSA
jgi:hypothetical protein